MLAGNRWGKDIQSILASPGRYMSRLSLAQRDALAFFQANESAIFDTMCKALAEMITAGEAEPDRWAQRQHRDTASEHALVYGEVFEDDEDDAFTSMFEDVEEEEEEEEEEEPMPFASRFTIHELVLVERGEKCLLGFHGSADWDEEHGLGVLMDGLEIVEIGGHSAV